MRERLEVAARTRNLSLTQEVIRRVEESFQAEEEFDLESGRAAKSFFINLVKGSMAAVEAKTGKDFKNDPQTASLCEGAILGVMQVLLTPLRGDLVPNKLIGQTEEQLRDDLIEIGRSIGRVFAQDRLSTQIEKLDRAMMSDER